MNTVTKTKKSKQKPNYPIHTQGYDNVEFIIGGYKDNAAACDLFDFFEDMITSVCDNEELDVSKSAIVKISQALVHDTIRNKAFIVRKVKRLQKIDGTLVLTLPTE